MGALNSKWYSIPTVALLLISMVSPSLIATPVSGEEKSDNPVMPGDANKDGAVNTLDITEIELIILDKSALSDGADANEDGLINALDITKTELIILSEANLDTTPDPPSHDFGTMAEGETNSWNFTIRNSGSGTLSWCINESEGWLNVNPNHGTTTSETETIVVSVDTSGLSPGSYQGILNISSTGGDSTGTFSLGVPGLDVSPDSYDFGTIIPGETPSKTFSVNNTGGGTLYWHIESYPAWLNVSSTSGSGEGSFTATVRSNVSPGSHYGQINVFSNGGSESIGVSVHINRPPNKPSNPYPPDDAIDIPNDTNLACWVSDPDGDYMNVLFKWGNSTYIGADFDVPSGSYAVVDPGTLNYETTYSWYAVSYDEAGDSRGSDIWSFTTGHPVLCANPDPLNHDFGEVCLGEVAQWTFTVTNCGIGTLSWETFDTEPWLSESPTSGSLSAGESAVVTVTADTKDTSGWLGTWAGSLYVNSEWGFKSGGLTLTLVTGDDSDDKEAIVEWINDYPSDDLNHCDEDAWGFYGELWEAGWFCMIYGNDQAWEVDYIDEKEGGSNIVDYYDLAAFSGHGGNGALAFSYHDAFSSMGWYFLHPHEAKLGGRDLEWIGFSSCEILDDDHYPEWALAMNGIHLICGWKTTMPDASDMLPGWVRRMKDGQTVINAWFHSGDHVASFKTLRVLGEEGYYEDDHLWGEGYVGPDVIPDGWYWVWTFDTWL